MSGLDELLECPRCGDCWPASETICETCEARLLPYPERPAPKRRYKVTSVSGYPIVPEKSRVGSTNTPIRTSYAVLDTAYAHRIVAEFNAAWRDTQSDETRLQEATYLAHRLNREDES